MHPLEAALYRLDTAITHLEAAIQARDGYWRAELEACRGAEAEARSRVETVAARLDVAIGRLQSVLEE
jgi:hypothetical protein